MFRKVVIEMSGPLCTCQKEDLSWSVGIDLSGEPFMVLKCGTCQTELKVPKAKLIASFALDTPYPGVSKKEAPVIHLIPGGKE